MAITNHTDFSPAPQISAQDFGAFSANIIYATARRIIRLQFTNPTAAADLYDSHMRDLKDERARALFDRILTDMLNDL